MDFYPIIANFQPLSTNLTSLAGMATTTGFVKQTSANVFGIDTNTYLTSYTETDPVFTAWLGTVTPANWNTAYSQTLEWNGGATNLVAATGRTSLGLGTAATHAATDFQTAGTTYITGSLTSSRVPYASGAQTLTDSANLTFDGNTFTAGSNQTFVVDTVNQSVYVNYVAPFPYYGLTAVKSLSSLGTPIMGVYGGAANTAYSLAKSGSVAPVYGLNFGGNYTPSSNINYNATIPNIYGVYISTSVTSHSSETKSITATEVDGFAPAHFFTTGIGSSGAITVTKVYNFKASNPTLTAGASGGATPTVTTLCGFYDPGMTAGGTNWGFYGLSSQNYMSGTLDSSGYKCGGTVGATAGPYTIITGITVKGGIVTAISGS